MYNVKISSPCFTHYARYLNMKNQRVWASIRNEFFSFSAPVYLRIQAHGYGSICIKHPSNWQYADRSPQSFFVLVNGVDKKFPQAGLLLRKLDARRELLKSPTKNERRETL